MNKFDLLNEKLVTNENRDYLGLSMLGNSCYRYLQHYHYWTFVKRIPLRVKRLFSVGDDAEEKMIADLKCIGITVEGCQESMIGTAGHWKGHLDGIGYFDDFKDAELYEIQEVLKMHHEKKFLVEFKTHNEKSFTDLKKKKVKASKPVHYQQMQSYMGSKKLPISLYMALNKNTSEYYFEWVLFDKYHFDESKRKELEIISSDVLLPRIGNNKKSWFECKLCDAKDVCFKNKEVHKSCRSCSHVDVLPEGKWSCSLDSIELSSLDQRKACDNYNLAPMFQEDDS